MCVLGRVHSREGQKMWFMNPWHQNTFAEEGRLTQLSQLEKKLWPGMISCQLIIVGNLVVNRDHLAPYKCVHISGTRFPREKCVCWGGAGGLGWRRRDTSSRENFPHICRYVRENMACSQGGEKLTNFLKFIHRSRIKNSSKEFSKMRKVKERSGS